MSIGYRVQVSELLENPDAPKYPDSKTVYEQHLDNLDIPALARFLNQGKE
jgi:hypothetical protein